eukprot:683826-Pelagomonas_calceolata.AAC.2
MVAHVYTYLLPYPAIVPIGASAAASCTHPMFTGVDPDVCDSMDGPKHVHFLGADSDPLTGDVYAASIPIELAMASNKVGLKEL